MSIPVISIAQMREWERGTWSAGRTEEEVIRRAGGALAAQIRMWSRPAESVLVLAGQGHNGEDARQAALQLGDRPVDVLNVQDPAADQGAVEERLAARPSWVIDGLFGIGLNRPLEGAWIQWVERLNSSRRRILSVDVPSGLNADTGQAMGASVKASITVTMGAPKRGLLEACAWPYVGRLEVASDIGLVGMPDAGDLQWTAPEDFIDMLPARPVAGHKGFFGHVAVMAGSLGYHGAAVLAMRGALRARPGLVTVLTAPDIYTAVASQSQAAMVRPWVAGQPFPEAATALVVGPGLAAQNLSRDWQADLRRWWRTISIPMVVDASALDWLAEGPVVTQSCRVITPHPGEAARLLKTTPDAVQSDRLGAVRGLSQRLGDCWVVLKGHQTLVGRSSGPVYFNSSGNPGLAQGGSGDLLAGYLGGLLAQPAYAERAEQAIRYAVWQHGACADTLERESSSWTIAYLAGRLGTEVAGRLDVRPAGGR